MKVHIDAAKGVAVITLQIEPEISKSGKSVLIASTGGGRKFEHEGKEYTVNAMIYRTAMAADYQALGVEPPQTEQPAPPPQTAQTAKPIGKARKLSI